MSADYLFQTDKCYDVTFDTGDKVKTLFGSLAILQQGDVNPYDASI